MSLTQEDFVRHLLAAQGALRGFILVYVRDVSRAEDILQEVSMILWRKCDAYRPDRPFLSWALGVARNEILHARRDSARSPLVFDEGLVDRAIHRYDALEPQLAKRRAALRHCIDKLPDHYREALQHRYMEAQPMDEVARRLRRTVGSATMLLSRIREALMSCADRVLGGSTSEIKS